MSGKTKKVERIAKKLGMSRSTLINFMAGRRGVSWRMAKRAAARSGTDKISWMNGEVELLKVQIGYPD